MFEVIIVVGSFVIAWFVPFTPSPGSDAESFNKGFEQFKRKVRK